MASQRTLDALALACVRLFTSAVVWWSGFRAISDDDYARVVIAQKFADAPAWDPSGTSWLPFPFWVHGSAMLLLGPELRTATAVAWASGVVSTLLIWLGACALGLARGPSFAAAALASAVPYSAWLGVATVPESLTTGLVVFGAATLAGGRRGGPRADPWGAHSWGARPWGALALCCATLSRYETWPVAAVFAVCCVYDALRHWKLDPARARKLGMAAVLASAGMLLWLGHGWANHGDTTFFIERVANYQTALGGHDFHGWTALTRHPWLIVTHAPALMGVATLGVAMVILLRIQAELRLTAFTRPLIACGGLVAFLIVGDLRGAGATHHAARTLLPVWSFACIVIFATWPDLISHALRFIKLRLVKLRFIKFRFIAGRFIEKAQGALGPALIISAVLVVDGLQNHALDGALHFVDRTHELRLGERARRVVATGRLLIAPEDYGYFAMIAAFGAPARADVFDDHDPRHARQPSLFEPPHALPLDVAHERLQQRLEQDQVKGLIVVQTHARQAQRYGTTVAMTPRYLLLAVGPPR